MWFNVRFSLEGTWNVFHHTENNWMKIRHIIKWPFVVNAYLIVALLNLAIIRPFITHSNKQKVTTYSSLSLPHLLDTQLSNVHCSWEHVNFWKCVTTSLISRNFCLNGIHALRSVLSLRLAKSKIDVDVSLFYKIFPKFSIFCPQ